MNNKKPSKNYNSHFHENYEYVTDSNGYRKLINKKTRKSVNRVNEFFKDLKSIKLDKPYNNYKKYHTSTYSTLEDVENYRFVADVVNTIRDSIVKQKQDNWDIVKIKRNTALFSLAYLTAGRASELTYITLKDVYVYKNELSKYFVRVRLPNAKNRQSKVKNIIFPYNFNKQEYKIFIYVLKWWIYVSKSILNRYGVSWKEYIIRSEKIPREKMELLDAEMGAKPLFSRITINKSEKKITIYSTFLSRTSAYTLFSKYINHNPHFFRKLRATHLYSIYGFRLKQLQKYLGHSNIKSSTPYTYIDPSGMENNFIEVDPK